MRDRQTFRVYYKKKSEAVNLPTLSISVLQLHHVSIQNRQQPESLIHYSDAVRYLITVSSHQIHPEAVHPEAYPYFDDSKEDCLWRWRKDPNVRKSPTKTPVVGRKGEIILENPECYTITVVGVHYGTIHVGCQAQRLRLSYSTIRTRCKLRVQHPLVQLDAHSQGSPWENCRVLLMVAVLDLGKY